MPLDGLPNQQLDLAAQAIYIWQRINPRNDRLIRDKLQLANEQLGKDIKKANAEIRFANRLNLNKTGVEMAVSEMWEQKVDDHAERCYEIFCHHWNLLGEKQTSAFVRSALAVLLSSVEQLGQSAAHEANRRHLARGAIGTSPAGSYEDSARAICERWKTKLDIEARELDLVAASSKSVLERKPASTDDLAASAETLKPSSKVGEAVLQFTRRGKNLLAETRGDMESAIAHTYKLFLPHMKNAQTIVRARRGNITASKLKSSFKNTDFAKALDVSDWELLIEEFSQKRSAGCRNLMLGLLARRTGRSVATVETYTKPGRKRKKTADR